MYKIRNINKVYTSGDAEIVITTTITTKLGTKDRNSIFVVSGGALKSDEELFSIAKDHYVFDDNELEFAEVQAMEPAPAIVDM